MIPALIWNSSHISSSKTPACSCFGAGCSTDSGIPDYRDTEGNWKRRQPVQHQDFLHKEQVRQCYWAQSLLGWRHLARAELNPGHQALVRLEAASYVHQLVTQNVDSLHQRAGSRRVIDLHGRLDTVESAWPARDADRVPNSK